MRVGLWVLPLLCFLGTAEAGTYADPYCGAAREFITTLEFMRDMPQFKVPDAQARELARKVSKGCTGAARRFIKIATTLIRAEMSAKDALETALGFASRTEDETETFVTVFRTAYAPESMDLDLRSSYQLASSLVQEFSGDSLGARADFERLVQYCTQTKDLDLPKPKCATFSARIARLGEPYSGGISEPFLEILKFLRSDPGPNLTTGDALRKAEEIIAQGGRLAAQNFIAAYRYANAEKGLALTRNDAVSFALDLTSSERPAAAAESNPTVKTRQQPPTLAPTGRRPASSSIDSKRK